MGDAYGCAFAINGGPDGPAGRNASGGNAISLKTNASDTAETGNEHLGQSHCLATPPGSICIGTGLGALKHDISDIGNI